MLNSFGDPQTLKKVGKALRRLRTSYGLTAADMAKKLDINWDYYCKWELGRVDFRQYFGKLCRIFSKKEVVDIFFGVDYDYYTADRVNTYAAIYDKSVEEIADSFKLNDYELVYELRKEGAKERYLPWYMNFIDDLFPNHKDIPL